MSVWCAVQICLQEAFKTVSQQCSNVENTSDFQLSLPLKGSITTELQELGLSKSIIHTFFFLSCPPHQQCVS